jgi:shikimate dehydrogenase
VTTKYAVIGDPVEHSLSPALHNAAFAALGIDARYEAIRVTRDGLGDALARLRADYAGFSVTTPLKDAIYTQLDAVTDVASDIGAVNTVRVEKGLMTGHNTDGTGFAAAILDVWRLAPRGKFACVFGSGPAARAIAQTLRRMGAARLTCWSRNPLTAEEIGPPPDARPDLLVCALPSDAQVPDDVLDAVSGATYVFDVNYRAERSPVPASIGTHRSDGLPLLLHQGVLAFEWWTGRKAPLLAMRAALEPAS